MAGVCTRVTRNLNMEKLRNGYLFPEVRGLDSQVFYCFYIVILLAEYLSVEAVICLAFLLTSDFFSWLPDSFAWAWTHEEVSKCESDKPWDWWYHRAYTGYRNIKHGKRKYCLLDFDLLCISILQIGHFLSFWNERTRLQHTNLPGLKRFDFASSSQLQKIFSLEKIVGYQHFPTYRIFMKTNATLY